MKMELSYKSLWDIIGNLKAEDAEQSSILAAAMGTLISLEDAAKDGAYYLLTPMGAKAFAIQSSATGLSIGFPLGVDLNVEVDRFVRKYRENPLLLLNSFDWQRI